MTVRDRARGLREFPAVRRTRLGTAAFLSVILALAIFHPDSLLAQYTSPPPPDSSGEEGLFRKADLVYAGLFLGSLVALYPLHELEEGLSPTRQLTGIPGTFASAGNVVGNGVVLYAAGGATFAAGKLLGSPTVARTALRSLEALLLADALVTPFKVVVGRRRPMGADPDPNQFRGFSFAHEYNSFPSGHTAHLFAIASTLSRELRSEAPWLPFVVYPLAGLVGSSRLVGRKHWLTDVVAGATAGLFASQLVGRLHAGQPLGLPATPFLSASGEGVMVGAQVSLP